MKDYKRENKEASDRLFAFNSIAIGIDVVAYIYLSKERLSGHL